MTEEEFAELSAGHALGALAPDDERMFYTALLRHPEWRSIVDADLAAAAVLGGAVPEAAPPLGARGALLSLIARTPQETGDGGDADAGPLTSVIDVSLRYQDVEAPYPPPPLPAAAPGTPVAERADRDDTPAAPVAEPVERDDTPAAPVAEPAERDATGLDPGDSQPNPTISFLIPGIHDEEGEAGEASSAHPPTDAVQTVARTRWMRGVFALAASLVVLVSLGFGAALIGEQLNRPPAVAALSRIESAPDAQVAAAAVKGGGEATAHWSASLGQAVIVADGLPALASDQAYQLWFVRDGTALAAGLIALDEGGGDVTTILEGDMHSGDTIAVTVEPAGGSDQPTSSPIVAIPTA